MKKQLPAWAGCLLLLAVALFASRSFWIPITESSGKHSTLVLEAARANKAYITLDFGSVDHRIPRSDTAESLLDESALGQTYEVIARYHNSRNHRQRYYEVLALSGVDGTVYRSLADAEAARQDSMPLRIVLVVALYIAACTLLIWRKGRIKKEESP